MQIRKYLRDNNPQVIVSDKNSDLIKLPEVTALIQKQIDKYNVLFSHPEQVKKVSLLADEWTIDSGELTPSLKIKRKIIEQKYSAQIEALYDEQGIAH